jgi:hypothetical protein
MQSKEEFTMENTKVYYTKDSVYTFDILEEEEVKIPVWYAQCRENGKTAWLDRFGVQFEGEGRFEASTKPINQTPKCYIVYAIDPLYPEDCISTIAFCDTLDEAKALAEHILKECDIYPQIYESKIVH